MLRPSVPYTSFVTYDRLRTEGNSQGIFCIVLLHAIDATPSYRTRVYGARNFIKQR